MPTPYLAAAAGLQLFSGIAGASSARKIGQFNVDLIEEETEEDARVLRRQRDIVLGEGQARASASGLSGQSTSFQTFLKDQEAEASRQLSFLYRSADTRKEAAKEQASSASRSSIIGSITSATSSLFGG